jgi:hypothetical protein
MITQKLLDELKLIFKEDYHIDLTDDEVKKIAELFLESFDILLEGSSGNEKLPVGVLKDKK